MYLWGEPYENARITHYRCGLYRKGYRCGSTSKHKCKAETVIPVMFMFVEGPRVGWILAAEHPAAVSTNPVSAVQRSRSHTAPGEGRSHSSCHIHTHTGTITLLFKN